VLCADRANQRDVARLGQGAATVRLPRWYEADRATTNAPSSPGVVFPSSSQASPAVRAADAPGGPKVAVRGDRGAGEVPDPWAGGDADFDAALLLIEGACRGLVGQLVAAAR